MTTNLREHPMMVDLQPGPSDVYNLERVILIHPNHVYQAI